MMEHNEQELLQPLNIITTDNRTFNNLGSGVISGSSLNYQLNNKDIIPSIDQFNSPYLPLNSSEFMNIATLNVRSECNRKMHDILHKMTQHNIHILFVNEINIKPSYGEHEVKSYTIRNECYSPYDEKFKFFINADTSQKNSGC